MPRAAAASYEQDRHERRHPVAAPQVAENSSFIIYALGRSRTAWLSRFLTDGEWRCHHEVAMAMRSVDDIRRFVSRPRTGTAETGATLAWRIIHHHCPDVRAVVIRRDPIDAAAAMVESMRRHGIMADGKKAVSIFQRSDRALDDIAARPGTLSVPFDALATEAGCRSVYEFCLPYRFDRARWLRFQNLQIEANVADIVRHYWKHNAEIMKFKGDLKAELARLVRAGEISRAKH